MEQPLPLEIERKYLIRLPEETQLNLYSTRRIRIAQHYLLRAADGSTRRLRESEEEGNTVYMYNEKRRISGFTRVELEWAVSKEEFLSLMSERDNGLRTIQKVRWCVPFDAHILEIDVFPFWQDRAVLEVELKSEDETFSLPNWVHVLREVTYDPRYLNTNLAKHVPMDEI